MFHWTFSHLVELFPMLYPNRDSIFPLLLSQDGSKSVEMHSHEFVEISYVMGGHAKFCRNGGDNEVLQGELHPGDLFGIKIGDWHEFFEGNAVCIYNIDFDPTILGVHWESLRKLPGVQALFEKNQTIHLNKTQQDIVNPLMNTLLWERYSQQLAYEQETVALLMDLLVKVGRPCLTDFPRNMDDRLIPALSYMEAHCTRTLRLDEIAAEVNLSRNYFCFLFKQVMHCTVWEYLNYLRIEHAKFRLNMLHKSTVQEIAYHCGFSSPAYFCRLFKKIEGVSPLQYREKILQKAQFDPVSAPRR